MKRLTYALAGAFVLALGMQIATGDGAADIVGRATVIDGDTIEIHGQRIRLWGIDAPERGQPCSNNTRCGKVIANELDVWLAQSRPTSCEVKDKDRYQRVVAQCRRADGTDVGVWLVSNGYALDYPRYSDGYYSRWQMPVDFSPPWEWRKPTKQ